MTARHTHMPDRTTARRSLAVLVTGALLAMALGVVPTLAAGNGTVDAQVTIARAAACLEISTTAVDFGTLSLGAENAPGSPDVVVTNCGDGYETLMASGTNATGPGVTWTLTDSAATCADTLGTDNYRLGLATQAGTSIASLATANKEVGTLALDESATHSARIWTACPGSSGTGTVLDMQINYLVTNLDTPPVVLEELPVTQATADAAADYLVDGARDLSVAPTCSGDVLIACPGGVPANPAPQVHVVGSNVVATPGALANQWNASADINLSSPQAIPVSVQGVSCNLTFNTAAGGVPNLDVTASLTFQSFPDPLGPKNYIQVGNADVSGFETADFQLTGNVLCSLGGTFSSVIFDTAEQVIVAQVQGAICGDPNSDSFIVCPPLQ